MTPKQEKAFIRSFKRFQKDMWKNSASKGFHAADDIRCKNRKCPIPEKYTDARIGLRLKLIVSELAEALEALRVGNPPDSHILDYSGMEAEMADAIIRIADLAYQNDYRLAEAIIAKAAYNKTRKPMHGGKRF